MFSFLSAWFSSFSNQNEEKKEENFQKFMTFACQNIQQAVSSLKITIAKRKSYRLFLKDSIRSFKKFAIVDGFNFTQLNYLET